MEALSTPLNVDAPQMKRDRPAPQTQKQHHQEQSPEWASAAAGNVLVATIDEVVVGYLRHERIDTVFHVRDVFVHPDAREVGFGDALLDAAIAVGRRDGARRIEAEALRDRAHAYLKQGRRADARRDADAAVELFGKLGATTEIDSLRAAVEETIA